MLYLKKKKTLSVKSCAFHSESETFIQLYALVFFLIKVEQSSSVERFEFFASTALVILYSSYKLQQQQNSERIFVEIFIFV